MPCVPGRSMTLLSVITSTWNLLITRQQVGKQAKLNVTAAYALDMVGFEHNPRTMYVAADMPLYALKNYHGVGINLMNDQIGLFTHQRLSLQYSLKRPLLGVCWV